MKNKEKEKQENWEKRFDKIMPDLYLKDYAGNIIPAPIPDKPKEKLEDFIRQLLAEQKKEILNNLKEKELIWKR